jgi:uncharacterized protein YnzC (UPF0291/DUF896 family)
MPITNLTNKVTYNGDGATSVFPYSFKIYEDTELVVEKITIADGTISALTLTTDYTISGAGTASGGNVTTICASISAAYKLVIRRVLPLTQEVDLEDNEATSAATLEEVYDRLCMIAQQLQEQIDRSLLRTPDLSAALVFPAASAKAYIGWNAAGTALENKTITLDSAMEKASTSDAEAGTNDTKYMTPIKVLAALNKSGLYSAPIANLPIDTDGTLTANSDAVIATQKAVKTYADTKVAATEKSSIAAASKIPVMGTSGYMPDDSVDTTALKTGTSEVSRSGTYTDNTITGGSYCFYPQIKMSHSVSQTHNAFICGRDDNAAFTGWSAAYVTTISLACQTNTIYAQCRYVTASGKDHWIFLLRDKISGEIVSGSSAPDHVCYGNGGDPEKLPHPFGNPDLDKYEIILLDKETTEALKEESRITGKSILTLIHEDFKIDTTKEGVYQPLHSGKFLNEEPVLIETIPSYIKIRKILKLTAQEKQDKEIARQQMIQQLRQNEELKKQNRLKALDKLKALGLMIEELEALGLKKEE